MGAKTRGLRLHFGLGAMFAWTTSIALLLAWWLPGPGITETDYYSPFDAPPFEAHRVRTIDEWRRWEVRSFWAPTSRFSGGGSYSFGALPEREPAVIPDLARFDLLLFEHPKPERIPGMEFLEEAWDGPAAFADFAAELERRDQVAIQNAYLSLTDELTLHGQMPLRLELSLALRSVDCHFEIDGRTLHVLPGRKFATLELRSRLHGNLQLILATQPQYGEDTPIWFGRLIPKRAYVLVLAPFTATCLDIGVTLLAVVLPLSLLRIARLVARRRRVRQGEMFRRS